MPLERGGLNPEKYAHIFGEEASLPKWRVFD